MLSGSTAIMTPCRERTGNHKLHCLVSGINPIRPKETAQIHKQYQRNPLYNGEDQIVADTNEAAPQAVGSHVGGCRAVERLLSAARRSA